MWPGLVGKGPDSEPPIDLDTMLNMTAAAEVDGVRFDGVDLFLSLPHTDIDSSADDLAKLADQLRGAGICWPVRWWRRCGLRRAAVRRWAMTRSAARFLTQVKKSCIIGRKLRDLGVRKYGVIRIDSATGVEEWSKDPAANTKKIARTFREAGGDCGRLRRAAGRGRRNLLGRHAQLAAQCGAAGRSRDAEDGRVPGRYGAHDAVHDGL